MPTEPRSTDRRPTGESRPRFTSEQGAGDSRTSWPIRILFGDPRNVVRQAAKKAIGAAGDLEFVGAVASRDEMLEEAGRHQPNVIIMNGDLLKGMRPENSLIEGHLSGSKVIVLGTGDDTDGLVAALEAGARGYLSRRCTFDDVIEAVRDVIGEPAVLPLLPSSARANREEKEERRLESAETV